MMTKTNRGKFTKKSSRSYRIRNNAGNTIIIEGEHGEHIAEYSTSPTTVLSDIRSMYRTIDNHLAKGGTLGNYQW